MSKKQTSIDSEIKIYTFCKNKIWNFVTNILSIVKDILHKEMTTGILSDSLNNEFYIHIIKY
jgi:hypothetical protein